MKYQAETEAVEGFLIDLDNMLCDLESTQFTSEQLKDINASMSNIRRLLAKKYPLKAKKAMKELDMYIYYCTNHLSYNYFDELQRDSHYAY